MSDEQWESKGWVVQQINTGRSNSQGRYSTPYSVPSLSRLPLVVRRSDLFALICAPCHVTWCGVMWSVDRKSID